MANCSHGCSRIFRKQCILSAFYSLANPLIHAVGLGSTPCREACWTIAMLQDGFFPIDATMDGMCAQLRTSCL